MGRNGLGNTERYAHIIKLLPSPDSPSLSLSFKGVSLSSHEVTNYHKCLERSDVTQEVCAMCWEHGDRGETLYCGLKNGLVQRFSCRERVFEAECDCTGGEGTFVGLEKHEK